MLGSAGMGPVKDTTVMHSSKEVCFTVCQYNRQQEFSNDMIYSKLSDERSSPVQEGTMESFQDEKAAL